MHTYTEGDLLQDKGAPLKLLGLDFTEMVFMEGGRFMIGDNDTGYSWEKPETEIVFAQGFFIGKYVVTQELYLAVMGNNPPTFKGTHRPVEQVSHDDICKGEGSFLFKLNALVKTSYPALSGEFGLPSESQWEYAARGGKYWNEPRLEYSGSQNINDVAWYEANSNNRTMPVGVKQPNGLGLYDMSGNVWEWCSDWFEDGYSQIPRDGSSNAVEGANRVLRGGSYFYRPQFCRVANRNYLHPDYRSNNVGFRLVFLQFTI